MLVVWVIALGGSLLFHTSTPQAPKKSEVVENRIKQLDSSLKDVKEIEKLLLEMKSDLDATQRERERLELEYKKAIELQQLTEGQVDAISYALGRKSWWQWTKENCWGFALGVTASIVASFIYTWWKEKYWFARPAAEIMPVSSAAEPPPVEPPPASTA